ncbi:MAG TPA: hypothetical protein VGK67_07420 [Myxococcales bacterium]|jgi:hypothetical protein
MSSCLPLLLASSLLGAAPPPLAVRILSSVGAKAPDPAEKLVRQGTAVTLHAAVLAADLGLVCDAPEVIWDAGGQTRKAAPADPKADWKLRWYRIEVAARSLSNTDPKFHWEPVPYQDVAIDACQDRFDCPADLHTTILGDRGGLGTMAFRVEVSTGERKGASVGSEKLYRGGLSSEVARVTVRRDDTYLGYLTELFNTPYIWGSAGDPPRVHQAERRIGSDCADFVTYGVRRLGHDVPYTSTYGLPDHSRLLFSADAPDAAGVYHQKRGGETIPVGEKGVRPGDLMLFPRHVGVFVRDEPPLGALSTKDVMIHTCWAEPAEQPIAETDYGAVEVKVYRWKALDRK